MGGVTSLCCTGKRGKKPDEAQLKVLQQALSKLKFEEPAKPIGAAGGTASFYRLTLADPARSQEEWLGKDLGRAYDELEFYEVARPFRGQPDWDLLGFMIEYGGALQDFRVRMGSEGEKQLDLLVLRSLVEGHEKPRLLDLKIGSKTSAANWKGKSAVASWRQGMLDSFTNSATEGLRLEGFLNPPDWLDSEDPLHDVGGGDFWSKGRIKKAKRFFFQRMSTSEVCAALVDFRELPQDPTAPGDRLRPAECAELALLAVVGDLGKIFRACHKLPVPQKWIGSSVAVVTEAGACQLRPPRGVQSAGSLSHKAYVRIFDWGRSELNTPARHAALSEEQRRDREEFWSHYLAGLGRLLWEAARLYWSGFCVPEWASLSVCVFDYDSQTRDDLLGHAEAALPAEDGVEASLSLSLVQASGGAVLGRDGGGAVVNLRVCFHACPEPSRLRGRWRVRVVSAKHLPAGDVGISSASSDPYAVVALQEAPRAAGDAASGAAGPGRLEGGRRWAQARTAVVKACLDPTWDEVFEFPVAQAAASNPQGPEASGMAGEAALCAALAGGGKAPEPGSVSRLLPSPPALGSPAEASREEAGFLRKFVEQLLN